MKTLNLFQLTLVLPISFLFLSCSTLNFWPFSSKSSSTEESRNLKVEEVAHTPLDADGLPIVKFSEYEQMPVTNERKYRKVTRQRLEEESELNAQAGSMWVMEGQGSYLFSQNKTRKEGDLLNIKVESGAQKQIDLKVKVIKKLLTQLEEQEQKQRQLQESLRLANEGKQNNKDRAPASNDKNPLEKEERSDKSAKNEKEESVSIDAIPTRIVEKLPDGNYRIRGSQPFMIGKRDYKVIITGLIRPEDFNDSGVGSGVLIDPQYDVVSLRRKME